MSNGLRPPWPVYILAGGQSRRFGSDKARALHRGRPLLNSIADALNELAQYVVVIAAHDGAYRDLGFHTLGDRQPGAGPLAGLDTALHHAHSIHQPWLLLCSCDLLNPQPKAIRRLVSHIQTPQHQAAVFRNPEQWFEPFPGLYQTSLLPSVRSALQSSNHSMQQLFHGMGDRLLHMTPANQKTMPRDADSPGDLTIAATNPPQK